MIDALLGREETAMVIRQLEKAAYAGRRFTARYQTNGYYDVCASESGFQLRYARFDAPVEKSFDDAMFGEWLEKPVAFGAFEGGELLGCDPAMLETAADWGVRMINLTWNHANLLSGAHASDAARGLTARGRAFVREAQRLGILIDVSHFSARGFWDLIGCTERPIIASHSDCSAVFPHSRSLTDDQIRAVAETGGVIGVNFYSEFVGAPATMDCLVAHVEHLLAHGGDDAVAIGADFDGCDTVCGGIAGLQDVPKLWQALQRRGYPEALLQRIFFGNWLRLL